MDFVLIARDSSTGGLEAEPIQEFNPITDQTVKWIDALRFANASYNNLHFYMRLRDRLQWRSQSS
jgi:hypothetical protein